MNDEDPHNIYVEDGLLLQMLKLAATLASADENQMIMEAKGLIPSKNDTTLNDLEGV